MKAEIILGDCLAILDSVQDNSFDLVYLDPPFFTQKIHSLTTRTGKQTFSFEDIWEGNSEYSDYIFQRLKKTHQKLKDTGSIFFHCDRSASHIVRFMLETVFGSENFQSEIIWYYKRWSNAQKGLLPAHQTIFFFSKTENFKFNKKYTSYSSTTNLDQIMQKRARDSRGKSVYAKDNNGEIIFNEVKKGVPLSDVWEIPYLNPKAKERAGYPTQKPILLLERIIELVTDVGDKVLDPFCGSGTTAVAATLLDREVLGIDISEEAVDLAKRRIENPEKTESQLLEKGRESYCNHENWIQEIMKGVEYSPVQRNKGIDGILKMPINGCPALFKVQRVNEPLDHAVQSIKKASENKGQCTLIVIQTESSLFDCHKYYDEVMIVPSVRMQISQMNKETSRKFSSFQSHKNEFEISVSSI